MKMERMDTVYILEVYLLCATDSRHFSRVSLPKALSTSYTVDPNGE